MAVVIYTPRVYQEPMLKSLDRLGISDHDLLALFNNIEEIKDFKEYVTVHVCLRVCLCLCVSMCLYLCV